MKIAMVHLCSFGDCLYATLVARQIRRDFPDCELTWVIADRYASVLDGNPDVTFVRRVPISDFNDALSGAWKSACHWADEQLRLGKLDRVIFSQILPDNMLLFDGLIRSTVYRTYQRIVTGPHRPILVAGASEIQRVDRFVASLDLSRYRHVFLFECGPRSGQSPMNPGRAEQLAHRMAEIHPDLILLLSSDRPLKSAGPQVVDASSLTIRENAVLARHCTGLIGCSSGITWTTTSTDGKLLPMLQILTASVEPFRFGSVAADFERFEIDANTVIEMADPDDSKILDCIHHWISRSHSSARENFHAPLQFTQAHAAQMFRFVRKYHGTRPALRQLFELMKRHRLRFPCQVLWYELNALSADFAKCLRDLLRNTLRHTGLLPVIRKLLNRDPETGTPVH